MSSGTLICSSHISQGMDGRFTRLEYLERNGSRDLETDPQVVAKPGKRAKKK